ncbi:hypothetical protein QTP86_016759 [Hemibagrus guttatus]|nr:hypothetical protein QTP86_016759 [Hemibagrus guttatus]
MAAEVNYDIGNRELLSIKAMLEEWRHWLEGARHPFLVLTDHHNLEYLRSAKQLNPHQARWALFFTRFQFSVTYRPRSKNSKADALSRQFEAQSEPTQPDLILPAAAILAPVRWSLIEEIRRAHADEPLPANCPTTKVHVPLQFHQQVLQWVHKAPRSGHPGILQSTQLTRRRFWWPSLRTDVERFVQACPICTQSRGSPTVMQTVEAMFQHVFRNFGLPEDIVSDQGSQFTSRVWRSLCEQLGISVSLNSGYHPQSNGQLSTRNLKLKLPCCKLSPKFVGPFEIIRQVNPVCYRLRLPASYRICPTFHVSILKPAHSPDIGDMDYVEPPPPLDIDGSPAYRVHALLDSRRVRSRLQYLVDWEGYGPEECSWRDAADILDPSLSEDFHRDHPDKAALWPRGRPRRRTPGGVPRGGALSRSVQDLVTRGSPRPTFDALPCCRMSINTERTSGSVRSIVPRDY